MNTVIAKNKRSIKAKETTVMPVGNAEKYAKKWTILMAGCFRPAVAMRTIITKHKLKKIAQNKKPEIP